VKQSAPRSNAHRHESPPRVEGRSESRKKDRLDAVYSRLDDLEDDFDYLLDWKKSIPKTPVAAALPDDLDRRLSRLEARLAEIGQNGAEQREKISSRVTEVQSAHVRFENRFQNLEVRIEKVVSWNEEKKATDKKQMLEFDEKLQKLERLERRLMNQKEAVEKALEMLVEKTSDLPPVVSFAEAQEKKKKLEEFRVQLQVLRQEGALQEEDR
jgi:hypothetical protein